MLHNEVQNELYGLPLLFLVLVSQKAKQTFQKDTLSPGKLFRASPLKKAPQERPNNAWRLVSDDVKSQHFTGALFFFRV